MKTIEIKLPHITLAAMSYGEEHKPVIIALHGWLDNAASFEIMVLSIIRSKLIYLPLN